MADSCYSLAMNWNSSGQFCTTVWHYHFDDAGYTTTAVAAAALIDRFATLNQAHLMACIPSDVTLLSFKGRKVNAVGGFESILLRTSSNIGTRSGSSMVSGVNPVAVMLPVANAKQRGRWFIPGLSRDDMLAGNIQTSFISALNTLFSFFLTPMVLVGGGAPTATLSIYNRKINTWAAVQFMYLSANIGRQRRRQRPV